MGVESVGRLREVAEVTKEQAEKDLEIIDLGGNETPQERVRRIADTKVAIPDTSQLDFFHPGFIVRLLQPVH